jgi:cell division protein ZapA (FtsZ GTPase activity inhibitor)
MSEENLISITVWLAGRSYRIRIDPAEEEAVRKAVKLADDKVKEMRNQYSAKDDQDFLAMVLLMYATDNTMNSLQSPVLQNELEQVIAKIDTALGHD